MAIKNYFQPQSLDEAVGLLAEHGPALLVPGLAEAAAPEAFGRAVGIGGGSWTWGTFDTMLNTPVYIYHGNRDSRPTGRETPDQRAC